jgi:hypothetical protein
MRPPAIAFIRARSGALHWATPLIVVLTVLAATGIVAGAPARPVSA